MKGENMRVVFTEADIQALFGHEAAEDENIDKLRSYYFKTSIYDQVITELPFRILVGHKGIGKSALFQVAMSEDMDNNILTVSIKPDDVIGIGGDPSDFLKTIRDWKMGIKDVVVSKILTNLGETTDKDVMSDYIKFGGKIIECLKDAFVNHLKLNGQSANKLLIQKYLETGKIHVYIDDLDRGWQGNKNDILRISALLNAARDLVKENEGLFFRISLRADVYYLVRTADESTDKIEGSVIWHAWTNHEIFLMLVKRIENYFGRKVNDDELREFKQVRLSYYLNQVMEEKFNGIGHWANAPMYRVLMSLIRKRPRDLVKLCTLAGRKARELKLNKISTQCFENVFEEYSQGRLQDTINEYRSELPDIQNLLMNMRPNKKERLTKLGYVYTTGGLLEKINNIIERGNFMFSNGAIATSKDLAGFMYKINFLTARKIMPDGIVRRYFEENRYLSNQFTDFGFDWEIHPAYRWALQPEDIKSIYATLELCRG